MQRSDGRREKKLVKHSIFVCPATLPFNASHNSLGGFIFKDASQCYISFLVVTESGIPQMETPRNNVRIKLPGELICLGSCYNLRLIYPYLD